MFKFSHRSLILFSGLTWLIIGIFLMTLGIHFILKPAEDLRFSILSLFSPLVGNRTDTALVLIALSLFLGYLKAKFILAKSVKRQINYIFSLPNPAGLKNMYSIKYYILIGAMVGLGMLIRYLPIANDTRGVIDIVIGAALINGALQYFRFGTTSYQTIKQRGIDV